MAAKPVPSPPASTAGPVSLKTNPRRTQLPADPRAAMAKAALCLGDRVLVVAEARMDAELIDGLGRPAKGEPLLRWVRERTGRPIDLEDFVLFLDDLCEAPNLPATINVPASRARAHGILLHPSDVFARKPRRYGVRGELPLDDPPEQEGLSPAKDGTPPSPEWTARYQQPMTDQGKLDELVAAAPRFGKAARSLFEQLEAAGAFTWVEAAVRPRERGFLIYGSWYVSRAPDPVQLERRILKLERYEKDWGLSVPIQWSHPDGFEATVEGARAMADTYGVDYATPRGARRSSHYGGNAIDLVAVDLPRSLTLKAPDGAKRTFDLSGAQQSRDLSLTPELVDWIEAHFGLKKLRKDYPHWSANGR